MNYRRRKFISEYLLKGNATEAALKAGYSDKTAYSQGQRLLKNVEIMNEIMESQGRIQEEVDIKLKEVVFEIKMIALYGETEAIRLKALDMLMKHFGGYVDSLKILGMLDEEKLLAMAKKLIQLREYE